MAQKSTKIFSIFVERAVHGAFPVRGLLRQGRGGRFGAGERSADSGAREEHQPEKHERQEPRGQNHRSGGELVFLALAVKETYWM